MSAHAWTVPKASVESTSARHSVSMIKRLANVRGPLTRGVGGGGTVGGAGGGSLNCVAASEPL
jgi:hypothetical protein